MTDFSFFYDIAPFSEFKRFFSHDLWQQDSVWGFSDTVAVTGCTFPEVERHPNLKSDVYLFGLAELFWIGPKSLKRILSPQELSAALKSILDVKNFPFEQNGCSVYTRLSSWKVVLNQALHFLLRPASSYLRVCLLWACTAEQWRLVSTVWMGSFISHRPPLRNQGGRVCVFVCAMRYF